jgi:HEXXH motif-containing protein
MGDARFEPSAERARGLDQAMRARLADSLDHVFGAIALDLGIAPQAARDAAADIRARRQSPHAFGAYYDLVLAVERDDIDAASRYAAELIKAVGRRAPATWSAMLSDRSEAEAERYSRLLLPEEIIATDPDQRTFDSAEQRIGAAMAMLDRGFPEMADEIRELLFEIVIAAGPDDPKSLTFDGSSSYMMWGAILLNARGQQSVLDTAQALAHESGHNLLFGFCANGPLVENDDEEAFAHPLRQDPRPMDGVIHAAYVIARMHQTVERLLESGVLDEEQRAAAAKDLALHREYFAASDEVIRSSALLTPVGQAAIEAARAQIAVPA